MKLLSVSCVRHIVNLGIEDIFKKDKEFGFVEKVKYLMEIQWTIHIEKDIYLGF